jgi:hypothetical protein
MFVLVCLSCLGCMVVPRRVPTVAKGATDISKVKGQIDLQFIHPGMTTRKEVVEELGRIDVGINEERLFWGRWVSSSWGVAWAVGACADFACAGKADGIGCEELTTCSSNSMNRVW